GILLVISCNSRQQNVAKEIDTPTSGSIRISADESFAPLVNDEVSSFHALYPKANIQVSYKSESDAVTDLLSNKVQEIIISRKLQPAELTYFPTDIPPSQVKLGYDAVLFMINRHNPDSNFHYEQVLDLLSGKYSDWKDINPNSPLGKISIIFDNSRSGIFRYLKEEILNGGKISSAIFAVNSNVAVFSYVENDPASIGVAGAGWISAVGDTTAQALMSKIKLAGITRPGTEAPVIFYRPYRSELMRRQYPFLRELYIINRQDHAGLGTGFATYVVSDEGQTVVQRSGLIPAIQPERLILLRNEF
ncbi:MAG: substrate-binding domain-containing protein, partial [Chitinophagales bacterium]